MEKIDDNKLMRFLFISYLDQDNLQNNRLPPRLGLELNRVESYYKCLSEEGFSILLKLYPKKYHSMFQYNFIKKVMPWSTYVDSEFEDSNILKYDIKESVNETNIDKFYHSIFRQKFVIKTYLEKYFKSSIAQEETYFSLITKLNNIIESYELNKSKKEFELLRKTNNHKSVELLIIFLDELISKLKNCREIIINKIVNININNLPKNQFKLNSDENYIDSITPKKEKTYWEKNVNTNKIIDWVKGNEYFIKTIPLNKPEKNIPGFNIACGVLCDLLVEGKWVKSNLSSKDLINFLNIEFTFNIGDHKPFTNSQTYKVKNSYIERRKEFASTFPETPL